MTGFGSDSYSGSGSYQGGSSIYNPPEGNAYKGIGSGEDLKIGTSSSGYTSAPKWGAPAATVNK